MIHSFKLQSDFVSFVDEPDNRNFLSNIIVFQKFTDNYNSLSSELAYFSLTVEDDISELM